MTAAPYTAGLLHALSRSWERRGPLAWLLWPISLLYYALLQARNALYRYGWLPTQSCAVPLLVVGNVLAGGVGKTPVVMALLEHLQQRGLRIGVISRGYGRHSSGCVEVNQDSCPADAGDEPLLIQRRTGAPVVVAERRSEAADLLLARHPDTELIISDDGLQHRALRHDYALCVFDNRGIGNGMLLPAGPLREPWPRPVDLVLHTGDRPAFGGFRAHRQLAAVALRRDGSALALSDLAARTHPPLLALAAIAKPEEFFGMLRASGLVLGATLALPDHHNFDRWNAKQYQGYTIICTEKDASKLWPYHPDALAVPLLLALEADCLAEIDRWLATWWPAKISSTHGHTIA